MEFMLLQCNACCSSLFQLCSVLVVQEDWPMGGPHLGQQRPWRQEGAPAPPGLIPCCRARSHVFFFDTTLPCNIS